MQVACEAFITTYTYILCLVSIVRHNYMLKRRETTKPTRIYIDNCKSKPNRITCDHVQCSKCQRAAWPWLWLWKKEQACCAWIDRKSERNGVYEWIYARKQDYAQCATNKTLQYVIQWHLFLETFGERVRKRCVFTTQANRDVRILGNSAKFYQFVTHKNGKTNVWDCKIPFSLAQTLEGVLEVAQTLVCDFERSSEKKNVRIKKTVINALTAVLYRLQWASACFIFAADGRCVILLLLRFDHYKYIIIIVTRRVYWFRSMLLASSSIHFTSIACAIGVIWLPSLQLVLPPSLDCGQIMRSLGSNSNSRTHHRSDTECTGALIELSQWAQSGFEWLRFYYPLGVDDIRAIPSSTFAAKPTDFCLPPRMAHNVIRFLRHIFSVPRAIT